jgi:hypothetical protein
VGLWGLLRWCRLHLPDIVHVVVVGHTIFLLVETPLVFLELKEKEKKFTMEVTSPSPVAGLLLGPPPLLLFPWSLLFPGRHCSPCRRCSLVAIVPLVAVVPLSPLFPLSPLTP